MSKKRIYLSSPYSSVLPNGEPDHDLMESRFRAACIAAGHLMRQGHVVFSPIAHSHPIHKACDLPNTYEFWVEGQDLYLLELFDELAVLMLPGWEVSKGIRSEINQALTDGMDITYRRPEDLGIVKGLRVDRVV